MMYVKIHKYEHTEITAVCEKDLLGKRIQQGDAELAITESFYKGELKSKQEVIEILKKASNANLVGEEAVACGIAAKIITEDAAIMIGGIPHAQFYALE